MFLRDHQYWLRSLQDGQPALVQITLLVFPRCFQLFLLRRNPGGAVRSGRQPGGLLAGPGEVSQADLLFHVHHGYDLILL